MAVEEPLRRVVAVRLGQAVWVFLGGHFLPMGKVEGDLYKCRVSNGEFLVNMADLLPVF